jgi:replication factor C subunit 3/5
MNDNMEYNDSIFDALWIKKYAPQNISEMVLSEENRQKVEEYIRNEDIPSLLFCGRPGQGKTTLATLLCKEINATVLMINASFDNGIDVIRGRVNNFVQTMSATGSLKVVILDEADRLSPQSQDALRGMIEDNAAHTRFILTANEQARITSALQSRCVSLNIIPPFKDFQRHICSILKKENVIVRKEILADFISLIKSFYPDLRRTIGVIQKCVNNRVLEINSQADPTLFVSKIYEAIIDDVDPINIRKIWIQSEDSFQADYQSLLKSFHSFIYNKEDISPVQKANILLEIADALRDSVFVLDQEINFYALIIRTMKLFSKL